MHTKLTWFIARSAYKGSAEDTYKYYLDIDNSYARALFRHELFNLYHKKDQTPVNERAALALGKKIAKRLLSSGNNKN